MWSSQHGPLTRFTSFYPVTSDGLLRKHRHQPGKVSVVLKRGLVRSFALTITALRNWPQQPALTSPAVALRT